jgi:predicted transcriptional regulator
MMDGMSGSEFTKWMKENGLRVADVASKTGLDPNTVYAFRRGESVMRSTIRLINDFVADYEQSKSKVKAVS